MITVPNGANCQLLKLDVDLPTKGGKRGWAHFFSDKEFPSNFVAFQMAKRRRRRRTILHRDGIVILVLIYSFPGLLKSAIVLAKFNFYEL